MYTEQLVYVREQLNLNECSFSIITAWLAPPPFSPSMRKHGMYAALVKSLQILFISRVYRLFFTNRRSVHGSEMFSCLFSCPLIHRCSGLSLKPPKGLLCFMENTKMLSGVIISSPSPDPKPLLAPSCHQSKQPLDNEGGLCRSEELVNLAALTGSAVSLRKPLKCNDSFTETERGDPKDAPIDRRVPQSSNKPGCNYGKWAGHFLHLPPECFTEDACMHLSACTAVKGACRVCTKGLQCSSMSSSLSSPFLPLLLGCTPTTTAAPPHALPLHKLMQHTPSLFSGPEL